MGLDMYLSAEKYISPFRHSTEERALGEKIGALIGVTPDPDENSETGRVEGVKIRMGYWRKANQIHAWFVKNCQGGRDDCQDASVEREQLEELRELCKQIQADPMMAPELLPTESGFFFGSTGYEDGYMQDLADTIRIIDGALALEGSWDFIYRSSW